MVDYMDNIGIIKKRKIDYDVHSDVSLKTPQEFMVKLWESLNCFDWLESGINSRSADFFNKSQRYFDRALELNENEIKNSIINNIIARLRVARSGMCLKDRDILLKEIELLEKEIKR